MEGGVLFPSADFLLDLAHGVKLVTFAAEEEELLAAAFTFLGGVLA